MSLLSSHVDIWNLAMASCLLLILGRCAPGAAHLYNPLGEGNDRDFAGDDISVITMLRDGERSQHSLPGTNFARDSATSTIRKILPTALARSDESSEKVSTASQMCDIDTSLSITQDSGSFSPGGLPTFHVNIANTCPCMFSDVRIACGEFSSATLVNPMVFRRVSHDTCLLNNGRYIFPEEMISFEYTSSFAFPLSPSRGTLVC